MASSSSIVIKVKYGEALRRFKASVFENKLLSLNPLRITVKLNNGNPTGSTRTSAPVSLSQSQLPHHPLNSEVSQTIKLPLYQPQSQTWNPAASETPKSPLLKPVCWNPVVPKTPTSPLIQPQSQPLKPTPSWPLVQPQFLQSNPAVPKTPMSPPQPQFEPWTPVFSKSQSRTLNTHSTPMAPGVAEFFEKMKTTGLNRVPASMTGASLPQLIGGTSNVAGQQNVNSESSTVKNTKVSANSNVGNFNMMDKKPPKVTEDVKFKDVQPLKFVDFKFSDIQFQSVKAPSNATNSFKWSSMKNKETTDSVKDSKKVEVNHEVRCLFSCNDLVRCNSCGIHPSAPWFKSIVKENYDLCCTCFAELQGSFADYIRIDKPTIVGRPFNMSDANLKNFGKTLVNPSMPPVAKNPKVVNQDHLLDTVLPGHNIVKVSNSAGSNVDSPHKDQEKNFAINDSSVNNGDVSSTMATTLTGPAGPVESESTMDSPPVEPTVGLSTTSLEPISFPTVPPIVSGASSSTVAVGQTSAIATQNGSDEWEETQEWVSDFDFEKTLDDLYIVSDWEPMLDELHGWEASEEGESD
ncbi:PB1 domain, Zinc finger, ZZ-type, UBA-like, Next to BRCA1, central domain protein [Artemisia annua]|uniref:PB1 domain, Zinc finger, ZZ-type, UBA-like, Next to BRCA1, central domain protein n=1 Tax=Artemisia annua TaxID=35608 RepID=A0A2U1P8J8_ARTAN|nr:PB1 domain, Zinc finger, ZZ-type, UBA-like, Next to BRCA1, central domain protein [Artemisia annua]